MHWTSDCPFQKEIQEVIKRSKEPGAKKVERESAMLTHSRSLTNPDSVEIDSLQDPEYEMNSAYITESIPSKAHILSPTCVQMDTQASNHLFKNKDLLTNHRPLVRPIVFRGVEKKGKGLFVTMCGDFEEWKGVPYHNDSSANLLSLSKTKDSGILEEFYHDLWNDTLVVRTRKDTYFFYRMNDLYAFDTAEPNDAMVAVQTVEDNEKLYTARELQRANQSIEFSRRLGFQDPAGIARLLEFGLSDAPVAAQDYRNALRIHGPELGRVKGKTWDGRREPDLK
jgi:hypothetical protein